MKSLWNLIRVPTCCVDLTKFGATSRPGSGHKALALGTTFQPRWGWSPSGGHSVLVEVPSQPLWRPLPALPLPLPRTLPVPALVGMARTAPQGWGHCRTVKGQPTHKAAPARGADEASRRGRVGKNLVKNTKFIFVLILK